MNAAAKKLVDRKPVVPEHLRELAEQLPLTLGLKEAAAVMCMHQRSLQRLIAAREICAMRSKLSGGSRVFITRSEIIRWMAAHAAR